MARKHKHEEHENHERWLVSYADFITLLFAFFVVMYSVSRVDNKKLSQAVTGIQWALHYQGSGGVAAVPIFEGPPSEGGCVVNMGVSAKAPSGNVKLALEAVQRKIERRLRHQLIDRNATHEVVISMEGKRLAVRLAAAHFFDAGQSALRPEALPVIDAIGAELAELGRPLRVEGHTDVAPPSGSRYRNNWDLSASRAATVVSYLEGAHHLKAEMLTAAGMGSAHPIADNGTLEGRELNRRVELVVELAPEDAMRLAAR